MQPLKGLQSGKGGKNVLFFIASPFEPRLSMFQLLLESP